jgi:pimeloyl-ACP methyl ester carboxylesterase
MMLRSVGIAGFLLYFGALVWLVANAGKMIFLPPATFTPQTPAAAGLAFEDLRIPVTADTYAHAWWIPAKEQTATVLVYFHGNAEVLEDEVDREVPLFHQTGANVLLVDFRGYGSSSPLRAGGSTAAADARAAMLYLRQRGVRDSDVVICGWSIGSAIAARLAAETPEARGLILISPISSVSDVANEAWLFRYVLRPAELFLGANRFDTAGRMAAIHMPVLILSGSIDDLAQPWMARKIYAGAKEPKTLQFIDGAGHNDVMEARDGTIERRLAAFIGPAAGQ